MSAGDLTERVAFDREALTPDGYGGDDRTWNELFVCAAEFRYQRGQESVDAGGLTGTAVFKVKIMSHTAARGLRASDSMRDVRRGVRYNIREVDAITDLAYVWLVVENGVAV